MKFEPVIKWTGSKRAQTSSIIQRFPKQIDTYYEPFCGGASVLRALLELQKGLFCPIKVNNFICSDINYDLINLWNFIKTKPKEISAHYAKLWNELNTTNKSLCEKRDYFNAIRDRYNKEHNPLDFMFIMRTVTNGMPRYNSNGEFNNTFHITRDGIIPETLTKIINEWSYILNKYNVQFMCCDYTKINPTSKDFLYLDPPYANTKGIYYGGIDLNKFWDYLRAVNCGYVLSFDGISGAKDNTYNIPKDIYDEHIYTESGNSSFKRVLCKSNDSIVHESLYIKRSK